MAKPGQDKVVTQHHRRAFTQRGGPSPANPVRYAGANEAYLSFDDSDNPPGRGDIDPIFTPSVRQRGAYDRIGSSFNAPDAPTVTVSHMLNHGGVPWVDFDMTCPHNYYEAAGVCKRPDDQINGWTDWMKIYSYASATSRTENNQTTAEDNDDASMIDIDYSCDKIYKIGALNFGEKAAPEVEREVVDVVYASSIECGNCGIRNDGTQRIYALTKSSGAGSPGTPAELIYTIDGGATWTQTNISTLGGTTDPTGLEIVGNYVVVLDTAGNGYHFAEINVYTGAPGSWTNVTAGFVASKQPTDIYVISPTEVYFSGNGGYVYKSTDIPSGVTVIEAGNVNTVNYRRITGDLGDTIVIGGESGRVVKSLNRGTTFANVTLSPTSATITAVQCLDAFRYWIGTSGGAVYWTENGGETFTQSTLPGGTHTVVDDIYAATDEVIHISTRVSSTAQLVTTWYGGAVWTSSAVATQRIQNFPTATRFNRIACPRDVDPTTASNYIALGGLSGGGTDGALFIGAVNKV